MHAYALRIRHSIYRRGTAAYPLRTLPGHGVPVGRGGEMTDGADVLC
jgi:hypothetical protein